MTSSPWDLLEESWWSSDLHGCRFCFPQSGQFSTAEMVRHAPDCRYMRALGERIDAYKIPVLYGESADLAPEQAAGRAIRDFVRRVNARAEGEIARTHVIAGAHHRAIEAELHTLAVLGLMEDRHERIEKVLQEIRQWDMLRAMAGTDGKMHEPTVDAPYWRERIDWALSDPPHDWAEKR